MLWKVATKCRAMAEAEAVVDMPSRGRGTRSVGNQSCRGRARVGWLPEAGRESWGRLPQGCGSRPGRLGLRGLSNVGRSSSLVVCVCVCSGWTCECEDCTDILYSLTSSVPRRAPWPGVEVVRRHRARFNDGTLAESSSPFFPFVSPLPSPLLLGAAPRLLRAALATHCPGCALVDVERWRSSGQQCASSLYG